MSFITYAQAGFTTELLPILPPEAKINPASPQAANLEKSRGKVPGRKTREGWYGLADWTARITTEDETERWAGWGAGIGMQGRLYPAVDIDVEEEEIADAIESEALIALGAAPARYGRGARRLLVYRGAGFAKRRLAFRLGGRSDVPAPGRGVGGEGVHHRRGDDVLDEGCERETAGAGFGSPDPADIVHAVEFLGQGQQYLVEGIHPRTGQPYAWRAGRSPATMGSPEALCPIEPEEVEAFYERVVWMIEELYDGEIVGGAGGATGQGGGHGDGVWQAGLLAPSIDAIGQVLDAIENDVDYDEWLSIMAAVKGAAGENEAEAFEKFALWSAESGKDDPDITASKWESLRPPFRVGWDSLARRASERTGGAFNSARFDFAPVAAFAARAGSAGDEGDEGDDDPVEAMFRDYAWVEGVKRAVCRQDGALLDQEQFNARLNRAVKRSGKVQAWNLFIDNKSGRRKGYSSLTFRPGQGLEVRENMPGLSGLCLNTWSPPESAAALPAAGSVGDDAVRPWLDLAAIVIPDARERDHVLNWMAYTAQHPGEKINHALVIGSTHQGVGKDTLIQPLLWLVGEEYSGNVDPEDLVGQFNEVLERKKLIVVQEVHSFARKETMNRLKNLLAAPPHTLVVKRKYMAPMSIPNIVSVIFFTNEPDALAPAKGERRLFITWNDNPAAPRDLFDRVHSWLQQDGRAAVARWLLDRDVSAFDAKGRAPSTEAKETMRKETRNQLQEWIEDGISEGDFPFDRDLVLVGDLLAAVPEWARHRGDKPSPQRLGKALDRAGAKRVGDKVRVPGATGSGRIWAVRRSEMYEGLSTTKLRDLLLDQRAKAEAAAGLEGGREFR
jgi:hypothetical protein